MRTESYCVRQLDTAKPTAFEVRTTKVPASNHFPASFIPKVDGN